MSSLSDKQLRFARSLAALIEQAPALGYDGVTFGEAYRSDEQAEINAMGAAGRARLCEVLNTNGFESLATKIANNVGSGIRRSLHEDRLAVDLLAFRGGQYLMTTPEYAALGALWESMGADHRWGGRFGDGNHFSLEHEGRK